MINHTRKCPSIAAVLVMVVLLIGTSASGAVLVSEPFLSGANDAGGEYDPATDLTGQSPTVSGFSGAWTFVSPTLGDIDTVAGGLSHPLISSTGGSASLPAGGPTGAEATARTFSGVAPIGSQVYWSFLVSSNDQQPFKTAFTTFTAKGEVQPGLTSSNGGEFHLFTAGGTNSNGVNFTTGTTYLVVTKVEDEAGIAGADLISSWFLDGTGDITSDATMDATGLDKVVVDTFEFWDSGEAFTQLRADMVFSNLGPSNGQSLDEYRLFGNLSDIAILAVPEPSTFALAALGLLSLGFVCCRRRRR